MDRERLDARIRRLYRENAAPDDEAAFRAGLARRLAAEQGWKDVRPRGGRRSRPALWNGRTLAAGAAVVVVLAAVGFGIYAAAGHSRGGTPVVLVTDGPGVSTTTAAASATTAAGSATTAAAATTEPPSPEQKAALLADQKQRYARAHERAQRDLTAVDFKGPPDLDEDLAESELVFAGTVTASDSARWNSADGQAPPADRDWLVQRYAVFQVRTREVFKGTLRSDDPVPVAVWLFYGGDSGPLEPGDEVIVLAQHEFRPEGFWTDDMYFLNEMDRSIYLRVGDEYWNIVDPELTVTLDAVRAVAAADAARGVAGVDPSLVSTEKWVRDVHGGIPQGSPLTAPVGAAPAELAARFAQAAPGQRLLYVGVGNRGGEMNAVLHTKLFQGLYVSEALGMRFDFLGASEARFGPTDYPEAAVGEFVDVVPIPNTMDFYLRLRAPLAGDDPAGRDFYVRIPVSGDEWEDLEYTTAHLRVFDLGAAEQAIPDQEPHIREFLEAHLLSEYLRPGDIVRVEFDAIHFASNGKWEVHVDSRGVQQVNTLTVERLDGAAALVDLIWSLATPGEGEGIK